jgi:tRNA(Ile)-lysidine synthase
MRNLIRNELGPVIAKINPAWERHLMRQAELSRELYELHLPARRKLEKQLFLRDGEIVRVPLHPVRQKALARQILADHLLALGFSSAMFEQIFQAAAEGHEGAIFRSKTHVLYREKFHFRIFSDRLGGRLDALISEGSGRLQSDGIEIVWELKQAAGIIPEGKLCLDADSLTFPLLVRAARAGDYFYPQGMGGKKKKVAKYLKDIKIPLENRSQMPVVCCGERICGVGTRADERFRVCIGKTTRILWVGWE